MSLGVTEFVKLYGIKGCVQMAILEKNFELIWCYSDPFGTPTKITVIKIFGGVHQIVFYFDNFILKK